MTLLVKDEETMPEVPHKSRPATTPEARENQIIAKAYDLVEQRIENGTATSQEVTHFLKLGSMKARLEVEKLNRENELLQAKTEALKSDKERDKLYLEALTAMKQYSGHGEDEN